MICSWSRAIPKLVQNTGLDTSNLTSSEKCHRTAVKLGGNGSVLREINLCQCGRV
jgi:hypothetical protein